MRYFRELLLWAAGTPFFQVVANVSTMCYPVVILLAFNGGYYYRLFQDEEQYNKMVVVKQEERTREETRKMKERIDATIAQFRKVGVLNGQGFSQVSAGGTGNQKPDQKVD